MKQNLTTLSICEQPGVPTQLPHAVGVPTLAVLPGSHINCVHWLCENLNVCTWELFQSSLVPRPHPKTGKRAWSHLQKFSNWQWTNAIPLLQTKTADTARREFLDT